MLQGMRNNAKHVLWPLTIVIIIGMGGYGVWYLVRPEETAANLTGKIWGKKIYLDEFGKTYQGLQLFSYLSGNKPTQKELLAATWHQLLLAGAADRAQVKTARAELVALLGSIPLFQKDGIFDRDQYLRILSNAQMGEVIFEEFISDWLKGEKLVSLVNESILVSPAEVEDFYQRAQGQAKFDYVLFPIDETPEPEPPKAEQIQEVYQANQAAFQVPPQAEISYLIIPFARFEGDFAISPDEVKSYYEENQAEFTQGSEPVAPLDEVKDSIRENLLLKKTWQAANEEAREIDRGFGEDLNLEEAASKSEIELVKVKPFADGEPIGELGNIDEVYQLIFNKGKIGEISYPIELEQGILFFRLDQLYEARLETQEEAADKIIERLTRENKVQQTKDNAVAALDRIKQLKQDDSLGFIQAATQEGLKPQTSGLISPDEINDIEEIPANLLTAVFLSPVGILPDGVIPIEDGFAFFQVTERIPAPTMPEDELKLWEERALKIKQTVALREWMQVLAQKSGFEPQPSFQP